MFGECSESFGHFDALLCCSTCCSMLFPRRALSHSPSIHWRHSWGDAGKFHIIFTVLWRLKFALTSDVSYFMIFMMPHVAILWQIESWFRTVNNWTFLANANRHIFFPVSPLCIQSWAQQWLTITYNHCILLQGVTALTEDWCVFLGELDSRLPENKDAGNAESQLSDNPLYRLPGLFDNKFRWELLSAKSSLLWVAQVKRNVIYIYIYTRNAWVLPRRCSVEVSHSQTNDVANYRNSYGENNKGTRDY